MPRKSAAERISELETRKKQIEAQLASLESRERDMARKRDARRKIVVGAAVLAHADLDPIFADLLRGVLARSVQRPVDQKVIADLL